MKNHLTLLPLVISVSLPPATHVFEDLKLDLASTMKIEIDNSFPQIPTPDKWLFSDPPMSDPSFENFVCHVYQTMGYCQQNCPQYFCHMCWIKKPAHLFYFCPLKKDIAFNSAQGHLPHLGFNFLLNASDPNFFPNLDAWEWEDDKRAKQVAGLIKVSTGESIDPYDKAWSQGLQKGSQRVMSMIYLGVTISMTFYYIPYALLVLYLYHLPFSLFLVCALFHIHINTCPVT